MNKTFLATVLVAALCTACASNPSATANTTPSTTGWPTTVVAIEDVMPLKPMLTSYVYKLWDGQPSGTAILRIHVSKAGRTQKVGLLQSSGHPNLDEAFINSAWKAQYQPYLVNGEPIEVTVVAPFSIK